jgi:EXLDI family protein
MPNKTIYVSDKDEAIFEEAQKLGNDALSAVIAIALKEFVSRHQAENSGLEEITVQVGTPWREQRFVGRELGKWQGMSDDRQWLLEAVVYKTQKDNWAVLLKIVVKAELISDHKLDYADWLAAAEQTGKTRLIVGPTVESLDGLPEALTDYIKGLEARDEAPAEYLDI